MGLEVHLVHLVAVLCTVGDLVVVRLNRVVVLLERLVVVLCIKDGQVVDLLFLVGRLGLLVRQVLPILVVLILVVLRGLVVGLLSQVVVVPYWKVDQLC
jgi:hypothetical protein